jgi:hypothetical protein
MKPWLRVFLRAAGFGAGAAATAAAIVGVLFYAASFPEKEKPWNSQAIKATFADLFVNTGDRIVATFRYTVENKTKSDYYFPKDKESAFVAMPEGKGLSQEDEIVWGHGAYVRQGRRYQHYFRSHMITVSLFRKKNVTISTNWPSS